MLALEKFKTIIKSTPLVSIDLIVRNAQGEILLGKRTNRSPGSGLSFCTALRDNLFFGAFNE
jgi:colanic acid biosynthesis protein WcaH